DIDPALAKTLDTARLRAYFFLEDCKQADGSWYPQHFGSPHQPDGANPLMGTARVMLADHSSEAAIWIIDNQDTSGGWSARRGGPVSIEETAAAISALTEILLKGCVECGAPANRPVTERETW